jgi:formylglycine-generating enzyme required for sulfatase activity
MTPSLGRHRLQPRLGTGATTTKRRPRCCAIDLRVAHEQQSAVHCVKVLSKASRADNNADRYREMHLLQGESNTDQRPVEQVGWEDAMEFCHRLSKRTGRIYTLPSEAQWEYACRAGTTTPFHFGDMISPELANYYGNYAYADGPKGIYREQTTPVRMFPANAWGLQDMHGNVWEWCLDEWHESYEGAPSDGQAWVDAAEGEKSKESVKTRLLRGGSWDGSPRICSSAYRNHDRPGVAGFKVGFRVVCLPQDPSLNS